MTPDPLSPPPEIFAFGDVTLVFAGIVPGDAAKDLVSFYHFRVHANGVGDVGHLNFRVGDTPHVTRTVGHIGFAIAEAHRGRGYAYQACRAVAPLVRRHYNSVLITCDPDNAPSRRTIEKLGGGFLDETIVPPTDPQYARGSRVKRRYRWTP